ncbi:hypothetical protein UVI_02006880 [Ustilaginoidea virens]|uniref:Uncharacterized protein n=1 Tax=Ustilaginoidea virens TaxID=1159556 RepID=A0A1B5KWA6_USTVR|nr:hypothetical protein UVI_02006880 [Ustilaginoidea virens]
MGFIILATSMDIHAAYRGDLKNGPDGAPGQETRRAENETFLRALLDFHEAVNMAESCAMETWPRPGSCLGGHEGCRPDRRLRQFYLLRDACFFWDTIRSPTSMLAWRLREATARVIEAEGLHCRVSQDKENTPMLRAFILRAFILRWAGLLLGGFPSKARASEG